MHKIKNIGEVKLNMEYYEGDDLYSDGTVEDEILQIVKERPESLYNEIISEKKDWAFLYHLSHIRKNIIEILDINSDMKVLEIGSGCGAVTGALAEKAKQVTCVDLSEKRSTINAYRNKNKKNIEIIIGNFQDIEPSLGKYDYVTLIGVFEYADAYIKADNPYIEFLNIIKKHLNFGGKIAIAIENKFGLKYFAGCKEDHFGMYYEGIENYLNTQGVRTFSKRELEIMFQSLELNKYCFYYPYPDYKLPMQIYSDSYLPKKGELNTNMRNFDRERMLLFDETKVFDSIIEDNMFPYFSNSFLIEISSEENMLEDKNVLYKKCSNDRAEKFSIYTDIVETSEKQIQVQKYAAHNDGLKHIEHMVHISQGLAKQFEDSKITICKSELENQVAVSTFCSGKTLEEVVKKKLVDGKVEEAEKLVQEFIEILLEKNGNLRFEITSEFKMIFGNVEFEKEMHTGEVNDIDILPSNIIINENGWNLIDYEWSFDFPVPVEFIIYRVFHYFDGIDDLGLQFEKFFQISEKDIENFRIMETNFQNFVNGKHYPIWKLYSEMGKPVLDILGEKIQVYIYSDYGQGYHGDEAICVNISPNSQHIYCYTWRVDKNVKKYRFDPCIHGACINIKNVLANEKIEIPYQTNGIKLDEGQYFFEEDPNIIIDVENSIIETLTVIYTRETDLQKCSERIMSYVLDAKQEKKLAEEQNIDIQRQLNEANVINMKLNQEKELMEMSKSWKLTKPLRYVDRKLRNVLKRSKFICNVYEKMVMRGSSFSKTVPKEIDSVEEITYILCPKEKWLKQRETKFQRNIVFSILVPLFNTPERFLREMIESVIYQSYEGWELCLADGSDESHNYVETICKEYAESDNRIKYKKLDDNRGISENTNACIDMATGEYIGLFDHDDYLHPSVLYENMRAICKYNADYLYTDEATFQGTNIFDIITKHCKPDFAIDNLRANNYICHFSVFKAVLLEKSGRFRPEYDGSQDHDLILRLTECAEKVFHIRKILYYWRSHPASVASDINAKTYAIDAAKRAVLSHFERKGIVAEVEGSRAFPTIFRIKYELSSTPKISILIPNKDHKKDLRKCIDSILDKTTYLDYEIVIIENNSILQETFDYYEELQKKDNIKIVKFEGGFNYSQINNFGSLHANGEYLVLLNNDTEIITPEWLEELLMYAQREDVAVVGGKLYYADDTVQHAGIVIGLGADRTAGHSHYGVDKNNLGYMGRLFYAQDVSAVTGACMMVKKSVYEKLGGLDEDFSVAYNDVDFCLKAREKGYLNVFTPYCELYHYESKSRGFEDTPQKRERFQKEVNMFRSKWKKVIDEGDPYYNPQFSLDRSDFYIEG